MTKLDMGYYNREDAEKYIDNMSTEDCQYLYELIRANTDRLEIIKLILTDSKLSIFESSNIYRVLVFNLNHD